MGKSNIFGRSVICAVILASYLGLEVGTCWAEVRVPLAFSKGRYVCVVSSSNSLMHIASGRQVPFGQAIRSIKRKISNINLRESPRLTRRNARIRTTLRRQLRETRDCKLARGIFTRPGGTPTPTPSPTPIHLVSSESLLEFGSSAEELSLTLTNVGDMEVSFELSSSAPWIRFDPAVGTISESPVDVTVRVSRADLWLGSIATDVSLRGSDGTDVTIRATISKSGVPAPRAQVISWMRELTPLPKRHFTWKPWYSLYQDPDETLLYEMIRINNGVSWADWPNAALIDKLVRLCKQVNRTNPAIPASIAFVDSPFTTFWPASAPPTYSGPERTLELVRHAQQMALLANYLAAANARYPGPDIELTNVEYDIELWNYKRPGEPGYSEWNQAMRQNYDALYDITKEYFPNALVGWYSRGWIRFFGNFEPPAWADEPYLHFDLTEQGDSASAVMYRLPMQNSSREVFRRTVNYVAGFGIERVIPWISLGAGYRPTDDNTNVYYTHNWNYDLQVSWNFGHEINDVSNPDWAPAEWVMIYPGPFQEATPYYAQHYISYVRGAHNIVDLPR